MCVGGCVGVGVNSNDVKECKRNIFSRELDVCPRTLSLIKCFSY